MRKLISRLVRFVDPRLNFVWLAVATLVTLVTVAFIAKNLPRGFDWSDEAWVYSLIANSRETPGEAWGFQHVLHPLFSVVGESILAFRVIRLFAYLGLAAFATWGAIRLAAMRGWTLPRHGWVLIFLVANVGTSMAFAYPPRYFGYNELTAVLTLSAVLLITLLLMSSRAVESARFSARTSVILWAVVAFLTTIEAVVKFTSAAVLGVIAVAAICVVEGPVRARVRWLAAGAGIVAGFLVLAAVRFPFSGYTKNITALIFDEEARNAYDHSASELAITYTLSLSDAVTGSLIAALAVGLVAAGVRMSGSTRIDVARAGRLAGWFALFVLPFALVAMTRSWFEPIFAFSDLGRLAVFCALSAFLLLAVVLSGGERKETGAVRHKWVVAVAVLAVVASPAIGAVGTNNAIAGQFLYASTLWAGGLGLALAILAGRLGSQGLGRVASSIVALVVVLISAGMVQADARHPYRTAAFKEQNSALDASYLQNMLATGAEAEWMAWLTEQSKALGADTIPSMTIEAPGAHLAFGNSEFASPWLASFWPVSFNTIGISCEAQGTPTDLYVLQVTPEHVQPATKMFTEALAEGCGLNFPADFELVAEYDADARYATFIWRLAK